MKKIIIYLIAIVLFTNIYAQDKEPVQHKFYFPAYSTVDSVYLSDTLEFFKQDKFMLGWHWGASKKISKSLRINHKDANSLHNMSNDSLNDGTYLTVRTMDQPPPDWTYPPDTMIYYTHCDGHTQLVHAKAIQYEPTLQINSTNMTAPNTNNFDNTDPIFGFKYVRGRLENDVSTQRSRLVLDDSNLNGQVVLDEPWMSGNLFRHDKNNEKPLFQRFQWKL